MPRKITERDQKYMLYHVSVDWRAGTKRLDECRAKVLEYTESESPFCRSWTYLEVLLKNLDEVAFDFVDIIFATKPTKKTNREFWRIHLLNKCKYNNYYFHIC